MYVATETSAAGWIAPSYTESATAVNGRSRPPGSGSADLRPPPGGTGPQTCQLTGGWCSVAGVGNCPSRGRAGRRSGPDCLPAGGTQPCSRLPNGTHLVHQPQPWRRIWHGDLDAHDDGRRGDRARAYRRCGSVAGIHAVPACIAVFAASDLVVFLCGTPLPTPSGLGARPPLAPFLIGRPCPPSFRAQALDTLSNRGRLASDPSVAKRRHGAVTRFTESKRGPSGVRPTAQRGQASLHQPPVVVPGAGDQPVSERHPRLVLTCQTPGERSRRLPPRVVPPRNGQFLDRAGSKCKSPVERCESGRIGLTANELTWETGSEGSNPSLSAKKSSRSPAFGFTEGDSVAVIQPLGWVVASRICLGSVHETL